MTRTGLFKGRVPLVLASGSPRRRDMLAALGITFEQRVAEAEEPRPEPGESPAAYAMRMARIKGQEVAEGCGEAVVLAADTVVALPDRILGKPEGREEALAMLKDLTGPEPGKARTHEVVTGVCLLDNRKEHREQTFAVHTKVGMGHYAEEVLKAYVETGEPLDKAGAYGIQGLGSFLVTHVEGSYTNVVGLPLARVLEVLLEWGVVMPGGGS